MVSLFLNFLWAGTKTFSVRILKTIISVDDFDPLFKNMTLAQSKVDQYTVLVHAESLYHFGKFLSPLTFYLNKIVIAHSRLFELVCPRRLDWDYHSSNES